MVQPIQPTPPLSTDRSSLKSALCKVRMKSLHSHGIQLLQGLTHFLRVLSRDRQLGLSRMLEDSLADLKSQGMCPVIEPDRYPSLSCPGEALSFDQRLDILATPFPMSPSLPIITCILTE